MERGNLCFWRGRVSVKPVNDKDIKDEGYILSFLWQEYVLWKGKHFYVVDQESRITGSIHTSSVASPASKVASIGEKVLSSDEISDKKKEVFISQFDYRQFVFEGHPSEAIRDVFELAKMPLFIVMRLYREGRKTTGHFGSISYVPGTITRAVSDAFYRK